MFASQVARQTKTLRTTASFLEQKGTAPDQAIEWSHWDLERCLSRNGAW